jgi:hypothetical protein
MNWIISLLCVGPKFFFKVFVLRNKCNFTAIESYWWSLTSFYFACLNSKLDLASYREHDFPFYSVSRNTTLVTGPSHLIPLLAPSCLRPLVVDACLDFNGSEVSMMGTSKNTTLASVAFQITFISQIFLHFGILELTNTNENPLIIEGLIDEKKEENSGRWPPHQF